MTTTLAKSSQFLSLLTTPKAKKMNQSKKRRSQNKASTKASESKNSKTKKSAEQKEDDSAEDEAADHKVDCLDVKLCPNYSVLWYRKVTFQQCDAGKLKWIRMLNKDKQKVHISHIYSYNKVMGKDCLKGIGKALGNTDFKILAWYVNEKLTYKIVKNVKLLLKKPMRSTGNEQFSVYVYYKTKDMEEPTAQADDHQENEEYKQ